MQRERAGLNYGPEDQELELRMDTSGEAPKIRGYVALYNRFSPVYGKMRERIAPGFFDSAITAGADVRLLFNHDPNFLLGRVSSGTLRIESDAIGLKIEATPPTSGALRDLVIAPMERRDLTGASFSFTLAPGGDTWAKAADGVWERTLTQAQDLFDVGPVAFPFYPDTSLAMRSLDDYLEAHPDEKLANRLALDADRLRLAGL